jgi:xylulokinase
MFIGLDIGTGSVKMTALSRGGSLGEASERYEGPTIIGRQSSRELSEACGRLLLRAASLARSAGEGIEAVAASGHGPSLVVVDGKGRAEAELSTWQDSSAVAEAVEVASRYPGFEKTGECFEAKLLAAWRRIGGVWKGETALAPKDYLVFLLSGERVMDRAAASTLVFFDARGSAACEGPWTWDCGRIGVDSRFLPCVVDCCERAGVSGTEFSRKCGLPDGVPVYAGCIDAWCEAIGAGAVEEGDLVDGSGTSTCISRCAGDGDRCPEHAIHGLRFRIETISSTGASALWAEAVLGLPIARWKEEPGAGSPVPILFLPYLLGERSPVWDEDASALFLGIRGTDRTADLMSAVFQGTAFATAQCLELIDEGSSSPVRAVGGGNDNLPWVRMKAAVSGRTYKIMRVRNAAPLGAALIAAYGSGVGSFRELADEYLCVEAEIRPEERYRDAFERLGRSYGRLYSELKGEMKALAEERRRK